MAKPFASSADLGEKTETLETLADGVHARTAEGDPNVGAVEGEDFLVCIEARATPAAARAWLEKLRTVTDKPVKYLVLTHYHAVRVLGASAFDAEEIITSDATRKFIDERGKQDWESEFGRMPRLFKNPEEIPGLTYPTRTFEDRLDIPLGGDRGNLELHFCGRGHTAGDIVAWHPKTKSLSAGDLVESEAALYTGDAFHFDWSTSTLDKVKAFRAENIVGGRGATARGIEATDAAVEQTRAFLKTMIARVGDVHKGGGSLKEAFQSAYEALTPSSAAGPSSNIACRLTFSAFGTNSMASTGRVSGRWSATGKCGRSCRTNRGDKLGERLRHSGPPACRHDPTDRKHLD